MKMLSLLAYRPHQESFGCDYESAPASSQTKEKQPLDSIGHNCPQLLKPFLHSALPEL